MSRIFQTIIILLVIVGLAICVFAILRSCNKIDEPTHDTAVTMPDDGGALENEPAPDLEDLYDETTSTETGQADEEMQDAEPSEPEEVLIDREVVSSEYVDYYVVVGAFLHEENAQAEVQKLKKRGYQEAELAVFDMSQYYSVFASREGSLQAAWKQRDQLRSSGYVDTYVHKRRSKYGR